MTAMEWHILPSVFWASSPEDQAIMIAGVQAKSLMQAWEDEMHSREIESMRRKAENKGARSSLRTRR